MGKFTEFKLALNGMPKGVHEYEYHLDKQFFVNMESSDIHDSDLTVKLSVNYHNDVYDMTFAITGRIVLLCDRCLDDLVLPVDESYHLVVKYGDKYNDETDELLEIPESDNYLNVAYMIFDTVALAIPMKHVHPHGECNKAMRAALKKHSAQIDDDDIDIDDDESEDQVNDPRWDELKKLTDNN